MDLRYKTKERVALRDCKLNNYEKRKLFEDGIAQRIFYGNGGNAWRLYVSKKDFERLCLCLK